MDKRISIGERLGELGALAALIYFISFSYGYLHISSLYNSIGLGWYIPYLPVAYFSMSAALVMGAMLFMTMVLYISLSAEHTEFSRLLALFAATLITIFLCIALAWIYINDWTDIDATLQIVRAIKYATLIYFPLCIVLIEVDPNKILKSTPLKILAPAALVILAYTIPKYSGKAEGVEILTNYGTNLPYVIDNAKKKWRVLHINEDKALVVNFPLELRSHTEARIMEIKDLDLYFSSPGYVGVLGAATEVVKKARADKENTK